MVDEGRGGRAGWEVGGDSGLIGSSSLSTELSHTRAADAIAELQ